MGFSSPDHEIRVGDLEDCDFDDPSSLVSYREIQRELRDEEPEPRFRRIRPQPLVASKESGLLFLRRLSSQVCNIKKVQDPSEFDRFRDRLITEDEKFYLNQIERYLAYLPPPVEEAEQSLSPERKEAPKKKGFNFSISMLNKMNLQAFGENKRKRKKKRKRASKKSSSRKLAFARKLKKSGSSISNGSSSPSKNRESASPEIKLDLLPVKKVAPPQKKRDRRGSMRPEVMQGLEDILAEPKGTKKE